MAPDVHAFAAAWTRYWTRRPGGAALRVADSPAYPLARTVAMPEGHPYPTGALSFQLSQLRLSGLEHLNPVESSITAEGSLRLVLEHLRLEGRYALQVKPDPVIDLDTAGNLMDLPPDPVAAGADASQDATDPAKEEWLDQAREQRTRLEATANGQKLLAFYGEHNETFDYVFRNNQALTPLWRANGATAEMANDTSAAMKTDGIINQKSKKYTGGATYNGNAFIQQLNVASACVWTDPDFDPMFGPPAGSKFWAAAKAALSFGKSVGTTTSNSKSAVTEMKPSQVHTTVDAQTKDLPPVSDKEMSTVIAMSVQPGGADPADLPDWLELDEGDQERLRALYEATMKLRAENAALIGYPLFEGGLEASIDRLDVSIDRERGVQVELPAFALDLDDSAWTGEVAVVARQRLEAMYFIRSLLHDALAGSLKQALGEAAAASFDTV